MSITNTASQSHAEIVVTDTMVSSFSSMYTQFLNALFEVYPNCTKIKSTYESWQSIRSDVIEARNVMDHYTQSMSPYYSDCLQQNNSIFLSGIDVLDALGLNEKWSAGEIDTETCNAIWQYIKHLNQYTSMKRMCSALPPTAIAVAQDIAQDIASQINGGSMTMKDVNISSIVEKISSRINPEEIAAEIDVNAMGDPTVLCSMLSSMMNSMQQ